MTAICADGGGVPRLNFDIRNEIARGYLLIGVFFIHGLYDYTSAMNDWTAAPLAFGLLKLLAPQIAVYFLLSGMSLRGIGRKSFRAVLPQSLMLIFLAWVSEGLGIIPDELFYGNDGTGIAFLKAFAKPIIYGTGGCTYVTWFFTVLAIARILVWIFEKNKIYFGLAWLLIAGLVLAAKHLHLPDNLYEWRNWPIATLFIAIGMRLPKNWIVPPALGLSGLAAALVLTWMDAPGMWRHLPCLTCHLDFVAEPMVGGYGFLPVYIIAELGFFLFMLWAAQSPPRLIGKVGRYFGRASLQFLLLHGWVLVTISPLIATFYPTSGYLAVPVLILVLTPLLHAFIFRYTEPYLNRVLAFCFSTGRALTEGMFNLAGIERRHAAG